MFLPAEYSPDGLCDVRTLPLWALTDGRFEHSDRFDGGDDLNPFGIQMKSLFFKVFSSKFSIKVYN